MSACLAPARIAIMEAAAAGPRLSHPDGHELSSDEGSASESESEEEEVWEASEIVPGLWVGRIEDANLPGAPLPFAPRLRSDAATGGFRGVQRRWRSAGSGW